MLFLAFSLCIIVILSYAQGSTRRNDGMEEYCRIECKGYKY